MNRAFGRWYWWALCALWLAVIFGHSLMPASVSHNESVGILDRLIGLFPFLTLRLLRKLAHFTEFFVLGFLLAQCLRIRISRPLLAGLLCALIDETVQLFVTGRSGQVRDVWIDFAGVAAAAALVFVVRFIRRRRAQTAD